MNDFIEKVSELILDDRNIKINTLETYISNLSKLLKNSNLEITYNNLIQLIQNPEKVINLLKDKKPSTIRNYLASIVVLTESLEDKELSNKYNALMKEYQLKNNENIKNNKKTDTQNKNWVSLEELKKVINEYRKELTRKGIFKKDKLNKKDFNLFQLYVAGSLYLADEENPPLRNDYAEMKVIDEKEYLKLSNEEKNKNNYLVTRNQKNKYFSLGDYKTSSKYGLRKIKVGKKLNPILNQWLKVNKGGYLLYDTRGNPISNNNLTKLLYKVFEPLEKNISSSLIRSIYISTMFPPQTTERNKVAELMLHSAGVASSVYAKE